MIGELRVGLLDGDQLAAATREPPQTESHAIEALVPHAPRDQERVATLEVLGAGVEQPHRFVVSPVPANLESTLTVGKSRLGEREQLDGITPLRIGSPGGTPTLLRRVFERSRGTEQVVLIDRDALIDSIVKLSQLAWELRDCIAEIDINPVIASASEVVAVDALVLCRSPDGSQSTIQQSANPA